MRRKKRLEVLVTDGGQIRRLIWIERTSNGIYWGYCSEGGEIFRQTYHNDGNRFSIVADKTRPIGTGPRLSQFKGVLQLASTGWAPNIDLFKLPLTTSYQFKRLDSVVYIDIRPIRKGVNVDLFLLEPLRLEFLNPLLEKSYRNPQTIHIFTSIEPWVAVFMEKYD